MPRIAASYPTSILHRVTGAGMFNGTEPPGPLTTSRNGSLYEYPIAATGGLFYWEDQEPMIVDQILVDFGETSNTATIYLVNLDDNNLPVTGERWQLYPSSFAGPSQMVVLLQTAFKVIVGPKQAIQIISGEGAAESSDKTALVTGSVARTYMR